MIAEVEEINAPLNRTYQCLSRKKLYNPVLPFILGTVIKKCFLYPNIEGVIPYGSQSAAGRKCRI